MNLFSARTITGKDKEFLFRQLSLMMEAGLPLPRAVDIVAHQTKKKSFSDLLRQIGASLQSGKQLSQILSRYPAVFSKEVVAAIHSGESTGRLGRVFQDLSQSQEEINDFNTSLLNSMLYPALIVLTVIVVSFYMTLSVIPKIADLFAQQNVTLPAASRFLIGSVNFFNHFWYIVLLVLVGIIIFVRIFLNSAGGRMLWSSLQLRLPVTGVLMTNIYISRLCRTMAMLIKNGVAIIEAVDITSGTVNNLLYKESFNKIRGSLERGLPISRPIADSKLYPPLVSQMILIGEQSGKLDTALNDVADNYKKEASTQLKTLSSLIEPVLIIVVGLGVAFMVYAILMPIYQIAQII